MKGKLRKTTYLATFSLMFALCFYAFIEFTAYRNALNELKNISKEDLQGKFISYSTKISKVQRLHLAELKQTEIFERVSQKRLFWEKLKLPDVIIRAEVPVEYNYYLDLKDKWEFVFNEKELIVRIPQIKHLTPTINLSKLKFSVEKGSFLRDEDKVIESLKKNLMRILDVKATSNIFLVQNSIKEEVLEFVRSWLVHDYKSGHVLIRIEFISEIETLK